MSAAPGSCHRSSMFGVVHYFLFMVFLVFACGCLWCPRIKLNSLARSSGANTSFFLHYYFCLLFFFHFVERNTTARRQSRLFESGALLTRAPCEQGPAFLSRCAVLSTGLPVVEGQDLERGGPASAGEVERAAGNRGAAGLHSAPTRHWYADALCCSLSFCLSVRASSSEVGGAPAAVRV